MSTLSFHPGNPKALEQFKNQGLGVLYQILKG